MIIHSTLVLTFRMRTEVERISNSKHNSKKTNTFLFKRFCFLLVLSALRSAQTDSNRDATKSIM